MRVEFHRPEDAEAIAVVTARWSEGTAEVSSEDEALRVAVEHAFRPIPVVTDDASHRRLGTHGDSVIQPGGLEWFQTVALVRVPAETGLAARVVPGVTGGGYDPASNYRTFREQIERLPAD